MNEDEVQQKIQLEAARYGVNLLRNNSGALQDVTGRQVRFGLGNVSKEINDNFKSSDLIACMPVLIKQEDVGKVLGVFVAVEVKKESWKYTGTPREIAQLNFINWIRSRGGLAGFANSVDNFLKIIGR